MPIEKLNHVNIRTNRLDAMTSWYTRVLGLRNGQRPDFPFPGVWLYAGDTAAVHLIEVDGDPGAGSEVALKLEHFAFSAFDRQSFEKNLEQNGVEYRQSEVPALGIILINVWDPDGNHIHVDFPANE